MSVTLPGQLAWVLLALLALGWLAFYLALRSRRNLARELERARWKKRSQSTRYGQLSEQFAPWMDAWPHDPQRFRFLGDPIDGVQFTDEAVYLVEIKSAGARTSKEQRRIRDLVEQGRVGWVEFRIDEQRSSDLREPWR